MSAGDTAPSRMCASAQLFVVKCAVYAQFVALSRAQCRAAITAIWSHSLRRPTPGLAAVSGHSAVPRHLPARGCFLCPRRGCAGPGEEAESRRWRPSASACFLGAVSPGPGGAGVRDASLSWPSVFRGADRPTLAFASTGGWARAVSTSGCRGLSARQIQAVRFGTFWGFVFQCSGPHVAEPRDEWLAGPLQQPAGPRPTWLDLGEAGPGGGQRGCRPAATSGVLTPRTAPRVPASGLP